MVTASGNREREARRAVIQFENVELRYPGSPAILRDVNFDVEEGSFQFITGASGAGKSSLLKLMYLGLKPSRGRLTLFGENATAISREGIPALRRRIGIVFQDFRLIPHLSALDNVALPLRIAGARESAIREYVPELLEWVGLSGHLDALPHTLSGGQQQRVAIARAVIGRPQLLLADEPTGNVDDGVAVRLLYLFEELHKMGTTVLIATHNRALVERFSHPCINVEEGRVALVRGLGVRRPSPRPVGSGSGEQADRRRGG